MKITCLILAIFANVLMTHAQYETVLLNYEKSYFGENQPLPADKYFIINGTIRPDIHYVEIKIYSAKGADKRAPLFSNFWKRPYDNNTSVFNLPVNYKLKEGEDYDYLLNFYRTISEKERVRLARDVYSTLDAYVDQSFNFSNKKLKLLQNNRQVINDLNSIVENGMSLYRSRTLVTFPGFSDMVKLKLEQIEGVKLEKVQNVSNDSLGSSTNPRTQLINELKSILHNEVAPYLGAEIYVLLDDKFIDNYPTERIRNAYYLSPHFGYGGVAFNANAEDFNYGSKMFAGMSFPLARNSKSTFLNNTSISLGAFLGNFEDTNGEKITGPLFGVPTYASVGYRPFAFFRIHAGAAFLEDASGQGNISGFNNKVEVRPFVGVSAELNVWFNTRKN